MRKTARLKKERKTDEDKDSTGLQTPRVIFNKDCTSPSLLFLHTVVVVVINLPYTSLF